ncbi:MAG: hypothetical protein J0I75_08430 [Hyphomicrobium sp.]|nr:hypothetical protein [Hyphomicrobium sp.]
MKITKIETIALTVPLLRPAVIASGSASTGFHVLIRIHTDAGLIGLGEASPIASTDADTPGSIVEVISKRIAPRLAGCDPRRMQECLALIYTAIPGNQCAKAGVDIALHDLVGKALGVPVYQLLGGRCRDAINVIEADIWIDTPEAMATMAKEAASRGVSAFEIKIGKDPAVDLQRVAAIRKAVGPGARLRIDCNEGYAAGTELRVLRAMEALDLVYIEQPVPRWDIDGMRRLADALDTPICADQGAYTPQDVMRLLSCGAADLICIKIPKSGLFHASTINAICETAGVRCTLGSMLPLGLGAAAIHHFAIAMRNVDVEMGGVYGSPLDYFVDDIVQTSTVAADGAIRLSDAPGLGVSVDEEKIARYRRT